MKTITSKEIDKLTNRLMQSEVGSHGYCAVNKQGSTMICFEPKFHKQTNSEFIFARKAPNGQGWFDAEGLLEFCVKHGIELK